MRMWAKKLVRLAAASRAACQGRLQQVEDGMPGEGEQIEGGERHGEKLLAVPEIMFELIAVVFQNVEALVLNFPSRPAAGDDFGDVVLGNGNAGHPGHGIFDLSLGVDNLEADPVDQYRVVAVADRNRLDPAVTERLLGIAATNL